MTKANKNFLLQEVWAIAMDDYQSFKRFLEDHNLPVVGADSDEDMFPYKKYICEIDDFDYPTKELIDLLVSEGLAENFSYVEDNEGANFEALIDPDKSDEYFESDFDDSAFETASELVENHPEWFCDNVVAIDDFILALVGNKNIDLVLLYG